MGSVGDRAACADSDPPARLHISGGASLAEDKPPYLLLGQPKESSLAFDSGAIQARKSENGSSQPTSLALQPQGGGLTVHTEKGEERVVLSFSAEGNLGLGTATPAHPLHIVRGKLAVSLDVNLVDTPDDDITITVHNVRASGFDVVVKDVSGSLEGEKQASAFTFLAFGLVS